MRKLLIYFFLCMPFLLPAQKKKTAPVPVGQSIQHYFSEHQLIPDSACSPYLYYKVYDWAGTRYQYAGNSKKGIDCSGFVKEIYKDAYCVPLQGGSRDLWTLVRPLEKEELQEGDILFFRIKKGQISHVGVYLGNNKFAHASVKRGVTISDLNDEYYRKRFYKGGRLNPETYIQ